MWRYGADTGPGTERFAIMTKARRRRRLVDRRPSLSHHGSGSLHTLGVRPSKTWGVCRAVVREADRHEARAEKLGGRRLTGFVLPPGFGRSLSATPDAAKSRKPHRDLSEKRRYRMVPVVFHAANVATASAIRSSNGMAPGLLGNDLRLCQLSSLLGATLLGCGASRSSSFQNSERDGCPAHIVKAPCSGGNVLAHARSRAEEVPEFVVTAAVSSC